jgi:2-phospho-L-lactate guanylyltransferase
VQPISVTSRWTVVVPLKASHRGKSRIKLDPLLRHRLVLAMAHDTVEAASAAATVGDVLVMLEDPADGDRLAAMTGVRAVLAQGSGLNSAILQGLRSLSALPDGPVAVLPGDLPSLTAEELDQALDAARPHPQAVVADRQGTGTTLLGASSRELLRPQYGEGSLARHVAAGAVPLEIPVGSGLRHDVDRVADLHEVTGPRTRELLAGAGWAPGAWRRTG